MKKGIGTMSAARSTPRPVRVVAGVVGALIAVAPLAAADALSGKPPAAKTSSAAPRSGSLHTAPRKARVDLAPPAFSDPTSITNPLFPISETTQVIQLGEAGGKAARAEVTLLPRTKRITWMGRRIETVVSQFVAYSGGRIVEVALDYFAQADDGSVWYLGENVDNYERGVIANHDGTWIAGKDGRAGMIMPADPQVGDVYRPENIPGLVFEEVTVQAVDQTVDGPRGPVEGAVHVQELLMDGTLENKSFAPGYGEFRARTADELVSVAVGAPTDALAGEPPGQLTVLHAGAADAFAAASSARCDTTPPVVDRLNKVWDTYRRAGDVPEILHAQMTHALITLEAAADACDARGSQQGAIDVGAAALDLLLRYLDPTVVDSARLDLWARQLLVDSAADDRPAIRGDLATLQAIRDRISHAVEAPALEAIDGRLSDLRSAATARNVAAVAQVGESLRAGLAGAGLMP
jgi:hypothetical protein